MLVERTSYKSGRYFQTRQTFNIQWLPSEVGIVTTLVGKICIRTRTHGLGLVTGGGGIHRRSDATRMSKIISNERECVCVWGKRLRREERVLGQGR